jgi:hypothetical protein
VPAPGDLVVIRKFGLGVRSCQGIGPRQDPGAAASRARVYVGSWTIKQRGVRIVPPLRARSKAFEVDDG